MKVRYVILFISALLILVNCDLGTVVVQFYFDSERDLTFRSYFKDQLLDEYKIEKGIHLMNREANLDQEVDFLQKIHSNGVSDEDSIEFFSEDLTQRLVFVNPKTDDSLDYEKKKEAHFWNIDNWYQTDDAVYFKLTNAAFEKYAEEE